MMQNESFYTKVNPVSKMKLILEYHSGYFCPNKYSEKLVVTQTYISYKRINRENDYSVDLEFEYANGLISNIYWKKDFLSKKYFNKHRVIIAAILKALENVEKGVEVFDSGELSVLVYSDGHKICDEFFCPSYEADIIAKIKQLLLPYICDMPVPQFLQDFES